MDDWTPAHGWEDRYEVTSHGKVRSKSRVVQSSYGKTRRIQGRELRPQLIRGYPAICLCVDGKRKNLLVHRIVAETFILNPERKPCVNHLDGDRQNNKVDNLEWCTHAENMRHAHETGLIPPSTIGPGEACPASKLNDISVAEIKKHLRNGVRQNKLAAQYGVAKGTIHYIAKGVTWAHIEAAP